MRRGQRRKEIAVGNEVEKYAPGTPCTVNTSGDMYMVAEARGFFGAPCAVVKRIKSGMILVALQSDRRITHSFPQRNVDLATHSVKITQS